MSEVKRRSLSIPMETVQAIKELKRILVGVAAKNACIDLNASDSAVISSAVRYMLDDMKKKHPKIVKEVAHIDWVAAGKINHEMVTVLNKRGVM